MTIDGRMAAGETLLRTRGADSIDHPGGTLLAHLVRVAGLLADWGADADVQLAGLCHAAYGTDGFAVALLGRDERALLVEMIGQNAEELVYLYAICDREQTYPQLAHPVVTFTDRFDGTRHTPPSSVVHSFVEITAANELDVIANNHELARRDGAALAQLFADAGKRLSEPARAAWTAHRTSTV